MKHTESIFALATSKGRSALHIHRISGENSFALLSPFVFSHGTNKNLNLEALAKNSLNKPILKYVDIYDPQGFLIDSALISLFPAPYSYTGENIVEISTHGNPLIAGKLQSFLRSLGFRDAKEGEFTYRAVLNGKLDLAQAEGINELIHSETYGGVELAQQTLSGALSHETTEIRSNIISILAYLEAHIDFAPDEVGSYEPQSLLPELSLVKERLSKLLASYSSGLKMREGIKVVLTGKPNAGKSSLYNALLRFERAIVTNIPGTTRDVLEERLLINNRDFVLIDTAGLRKTEEIVEKIGVERSFQSISKADIVCVLLDIEDIDVHQVHHFIKNEVESFLATQPLQLEQKLLIVVSKKDLFDQEKIKTVTLIKKTMAFSSPHSFIFISDKETQELSHQLVELHDELTGKNNKESSTLISTRQKDKVTLALQFLDEAETLISQQEYPEKIASVINSAQQSLEEIVGEMSLDSVYEKIFSTFCIGK